MILLLYVKYPRKTFSALILLAISLLFLCSCEGTRSTLLPTLSIGETYTDNRDLTNTGAKSDWISTVTPGITYALYAPTGEMRLNYNPSFVYYAQGAEGAEGTGTSGTGGQFGDRQSALLYAWDKIQAHSLVTLSDSYTRTDDPAAFQEPIFERTNQPLPPVDQTIRTSRQPFDTNFANVGFRQDFGRNDSITFSFTNTYLNNDDPTIPNNVTNQPSADLVYWFNELYGIDLKASYLMGEYSGAGTTSSIPNIDETIVSARLIRKISPTFDVYLQGSDTIMNFEGTVVNTPALPGDIFSNYSVYDVIAGVDYHFSPTVFFTMSGGYFFEDVETGSPASGYEVHADMAKQFPWGSIRLNGGVGYDQSFFGAQNFGMTKYYGANLAGTYLFTQHLSGIVSAEYRNNNYVEFQAQNADITTLTAGLTYQYNPWLSFTARYSHHIADSQQTIESYTENRATLIMTIVPRAPYLLGR